MTTEQQSSSHRPGSGINSSKMGLWAFISSETIFFSALIVSYIALHAKNLTGPYPKDVLSIPLTSVNTFILICSSFTMVSSLAAVQRGALKTGQRWLTATLVLGAAFLVGQGIEFTSLAREGLSLSRNLFGATFFTLTGFHGAHVFVGLIWIVFILFRFRDGRISEGNGSALELAGLYWHFVDLVWIVIFTIVYLI